MTTPIVYVGTKLSQNPKYGRPSGAKIRQRIAGAQAHQAGWNRLREIRAEAAANGTLTAGCCFRDRDSHD